MNDGRKLESKDYLAAIRQMAALCDKYPGSAATLRAIETAKNWKERGFVASDIADPVINRDIRVNPAKAELEKWQKVAGDAMRTSNIDALKQVAPQLSKIASQHPGTISEYIAIANLPSVLREIGERGQARDAAADFLIRYPADIASGYPTYTHYLFVNSFHYASLVAKESIDDALAIYTRIADDNPDQPIFGVPALWDAGSIATQEGRYDESISFYKRLAESYDPKSDQRVELASFKILEVMLRQQKNVDGLKFAKQLEARHANDERLRNTAHEFVKLFSGETTDPEPGKPAPPKPADGAPQRTPWFAIVVSANIAILLAILSFSIYSRRRSERQKQN